MKPVRVLLFDLDGTLVDSLPDIVIAASHAIAPLGKAPVTGKQIRHLLGHGAEFLLSTLVGAISPGDLEVEAAVNRFVAYYGQHLTENSRPYPDVSATLNHFSDIPKIVVSNKPEAFARATLKALDLSHHFKAVYGGDSFSKKKPDPLPLLQAMIDFALPGPEVVMVGDSPMDLRAGRGAGVTTVGVLYGWNDQEALSQENPDHLIHQFKTLREIFIPAPA